VLDAAGDKAVGFVLVLAGLKGVDFFEAVAACLVGD
jgi:hypothetical protein